VRRLTWIGRLVLAGAVVALLVSHVALGTWCWSLGREAGLARCHGVAGAAARTAEAHADQLEHLAQRAGEALDRCEGALGSLDEVRLDLRWRVALATAWQREVCQGLGRRRLPTADELAASEPRLGEHSELVGLLLPDGGP
jgi:hypothetical protein